MLLLLPRVSLRGLLSRRVHAPHRPAVGLVVGVCIQELAYLKELKSVTPPQNKKRKRSWASESAAARVREAMDVRRRSKGSREISARSDNGALPAPTHLLPDAPVGHHGRARERRVGERAARRATFAGRRPELLQRGALERVARARHYGIPEHGARDGARSGGRAQ